MEAIQSQTGHFAARALLTILGAALLWWAPATIAGLIMMFVGLICAVSALFAGDFVPDTIDALAWHVQTTLATRRAS